MTRTCLTALMLALASCATPEAPRTPYVAAPAPIAAPSGEYILEPTHSSLHARVFHIGLSRYTLRFTDLRATLNFSADDPASSRLTAAARAASFSTDFPLGETIAEEIRGPAWLSVAEYPEITFESMSIELTGPTTGHVHGQLTLHGVTRPVTLDVTFNTSYARHPYGHPISQLGFSARTVIRRSEFGVQEFLAAEGIPGVGDEVELLIEAEFARRISE